MTRCDYIHNIAGAGVKFDVCFSRLYNSDAPDLYILMASSDLCTRIAEQLKTYPNVIDVAPYLSTQIVINNNDVSKGTIVEVEAYLGKNDKASHAYNNKRTQRTEPMFLNGGISYVYLCYGMHHLFNIVVGERNNPCAILIRAIKPLKGINIIELITL